VDLVGYGNSSKPDIEYTLDNQQCYVDAWFDALDLSDVTLVLQDYGATFGLDWASRPPDRVRAVTFFEPVLRSIDSASLLPEFVTTRAKLRQTGEVRPLY
jgi:haloalkane dehalogenase